MKLCFLLFLTYLAYASSFHIVCYYNNWSQYRGGQWRFVPENINASLCTHIVYAFCEPYGLGIRATEYNDLPTAWDKGMYNRVLEMKNDNPNLKVILAIAGNNRNGYPFIPISNSPGSMLTFAQNVVTFLRRHNFDGFDVNWIYPGGRVRPIIRKNKFLAIIKELYTIFEIDGRIRIKPRLVISVALPAIKDIIDQGYDVVGISNYSDFVSIATYDFHDSWMKTVGLHSPLYNNPEDFSNSSYLNVDWVAQYYVSKGVPRNKIIIGIAFYGRSFTLADSSKHVIGSAAIKPGTARPVIKVNGLMAYFEVCEFIQLGAKVHYLPFFRNRYAVSGDQWVGYDDVENVIDKACYAWGWSYGGVMVRELGYDDFMGGACKLGKYPLLSAAATVLLERDTSRCVNLFESYKVSVSTKLTTQHKDIINMLMFGYVFQWVLLIF